jgi:hypothetical protein
MSLKYIGNCSSFINWDNVIKDVENSTPEYVGPSHSRKDNLPGLSEILDMWDSSGYKLAKDGGTIEWDMFMPGKQFDQSIVDKFCKFVGITTYKTAWISRVNIGRITALHWDVHDDEVELAKLPDPPRFHCHIGQPAPGHLLLVEDQCLYWQEQGATYLWPNRKSWHAGGNAGFKPKYLFNIW